jgi:hypothetical protein
MGSSHYLEVSSRFLCIPFRSFVISVNEIVDNQQFVLFLFSFAGPRKKNYTTKTSSTMTQNEDRQFLRSRLEEEGMQNIRRRDNRLWPFVHSNASIPASTLKFPMKWF